MNEDKSGAIIPAGEIVQIERVEDIISIAQRREGVIDKLIGLALKRTNARDWMNVEDQPYLVHSGAEKVARLFGIKLRNLTTAKEWSEDSKGRFYIYRTIGTAELPGGYDSIEALGTCSQRDKFFAWSASKWKDTVEIDETNIMKASYSNFVVNAVTHLLGLRNLTWDDLKGSGIDITAIQKVEYQKGAKKAEAIANLPEDAKKKRDEIWSMLMEIAIGDEDTAKGLLMSISAFKDKDGKEHKIENIARLTSEKWIASLYGKVKKQYDEVMVKREAGEGA